MKHNGIPGVRRAGLGPVRSISLYNEVFRSFGTRWWRRKLVEDLKGPIVLTLARTAHGK